MRVLFNPNKRRGFGLAFFFMAYLLPWPVFADAEVFSRFETQFVSEPEPLKRTLDDWGSEFSRGERQWAISEFELGTRYKGVEVSIQQRALADLRINADAAEFYSRVKAEAALTPGETVPVHVRVNGFSAQGLRLGYGYQSATWKLAIGIAFLETSHLMSGQLNGQFSAITATEYSVDAGVDYVYYRDAIFKRPNIDTAEGTGRTFDMRAEWNPSEHWHVMVNVKDLFAEIRWEDAPYTTATAQTNRKNYDQDGHAVFDPLFSGRQGYADTYHQKIEPRYQLGAHYLRGAWSAILRGQYQFDYGFAGFGAGYTAGNGSAYKLLIWPELKAVEFEFVRGDWRVGLALDRISWSDLHSLSLNISYGY